MIPNLGSGLARDVGVCVAQVPPPRRFKPIRGDIDDVQMRGTRASQIIGTAAQRQGVRYEMKAQMWLKANVPGYAPSRQFTFRDDTGYRSIIPDGYLLYDGVTDAQLTIFEIKSQHMPEAWWQLHELYRPVLEKWISGHSRSARIRLVEVCRSFDPALGFPCQVRLVKDLVGLLGAIEKPEDNEFLVFELRL